jgi:flagellin-specific chaperone FliS
MQNQEIIKIIENLKSRRDYEQKKATKLGFNSLYAYFEDKILKEKKVVEDEKGELEEIKDHYKIMNEDKKKKTCSCC